MDEFPYVPDPEVWRQQIHKYAKEGAERGAYTLGIGYNHGIVLISQNPYLAEENYKIHEVHNHIAFVGAGRASDITRMKECVILEADVMELQYAAQDVRARDLAHNVLSTLAEERATTMNPLQAVVLLAEIQAHKNMFYKVLFNGEVIPSENFASIGGKLSNDYTNWIEEHCKTAYKEGKTLKEAILFGIECLACAVYEQQNEEYDEEPEKKLRDEKQAYTQILRQGQAIEIAVLDRTIKDAIKFTPLSPTHLRKEFAPLTHEELEEILKNYLPPRR